MTTRKHRLPALVLVLAALMCMSAYAQELLTDGLEGGTGSTVGPDGYLYVTERLAGRITRVNPSTGEKETYAENLPIPAFNIGIGGVSDVVFVEGVAYAMVTVVGPAFDVIFGPGAGGTDAVGIYRIDSPDTPTLIADIGAWSAANPPPTGYFLDHGVQYAIESFRGGILVTDGHHNRVLWISLSGSISEFNVFEDIVPTGLEVHGKTVYMGQAGPSPHLPADGKVVAIDAKSLDTWEIASGAPLVVDVEFGQGRRLYALAQGLWSGTPDVDDGAPADPNTGSLVEINPDGSVTQLVYGLNQPTSMEFIGNDAYVVTLGGEIWVIQDVSSPPFGKRR